MSTPPQTPQPEQKKQLLPTEQEFNKSVRNRLNRATLGQSIFLGANLLALAFLIIITLSVIDRVFGYVAISYVVTPESLTDGRRLDALSADELMALITPNVALGRLKVNVRDYMSAVPNTVFTTSPLSQVLAGRSVPPELADKTINDLTQDEILALMRANLSQSALYEIVLGEIVKPQIAHSWTLLDSLYNSATIQLTYRELYPDTRLEWRSWLSLEFISEPIASEPIRAGLRTALLGTLWIMGITLITALPLGVGAAVYLEEYSRHEGWLGRIIETNIRNLAGVPSIIYGMLGLAVFVRTLGELTSGALFGVTDSNGRTVLSAGLTLALVILPVIIISAQEAIRAVPSSLREASYGLGATRLQTIWRVVLPAALPGIMTGVILSLSRAIGETAPLIVVGASTFIGVDPNGPFSKFTTVTIQIFEWTAQPQEEFRILAAAAIIVLLALLLLINSFAIILRQRFSRRLM